MIHVESKEYKTVILGEKCHYTHLQFQLLGRLNQGVSLFDVKVKLKRTGDAWPCKRVAYHD